MSNIILPKKPDIEQLIEIMNEDSKYEVACDVDADDTIAKVTHQIKAKHTPPKVPKLFLSGSCIFNCAYCGCRCTRDRENIYCNEPHELAKIALDFAKQNGHGIFISSAIFKNADFTQERIAESVRILREEHNYTGYIHAKVMPGADPSLINLTGKYASRLSVNIEVAHSKGYEMIAKQKNKLNILNPMQNIADQILDAKYSKSKFATSQTTQLMAGSTNENDRTIMILSQALYKKYRLKRVYYTAFNYTHKAKGYDDLSFSTTPYWRMARLYQADRLLELYGFTPDDVTPESDPFLHEDIDPKAAWAIRHLNMYPVEVNKADFETLIRVPGIGLTYAKRIIEARKYCTITHEILNKLKISLKRSKYFITCNGKYIGENALFSQDLRSYLTNSTDDLSILSTLTVDE